MSTFFYFQPTSIRLLNRCSKLQLLVLDKFFWKHNEQRGHVEKTAFKKRSLIRVKQKLASILPFKSYVKSVSRRKLLYKVANLSNGSFELCFSHSITKNKHKRKNFIFFLMTVVFDLSLKSTFSIRLGVRLGCHYSYRRLGFQHGLT